MIASQSVAQETLTGSTAAPRLTTTDGVVIHDTYEHFNPDKDPNLEEQVAIATTLLDNWLVTRAADYFSQKIYAGESLEADQEEIYSTILYPTYKQSGAQYLQESATMILEARAAEASLAEVRQSLQNESRPMSIAQRHTLERQSTNLTTQVQNARLLAKTKEVMFRKVDAFLKVDNFENIDEKVDEIVSAARLHALRQAIRTFESDLRLAEVAELSSEKTAGIERKLTTLKTELEAITGEVPVYATEVPVPTVEVKKPVYQERIASLKDTRPVRLLGGLSVRLAALMR